MKNNKENISIISKYRGELLGVATLMIVIGHSISIVNFPSIVKKILAYGTVGVNIFLFLSGIGLYYSLKNKSDKRVFYKKRFMKVFVPYFMIAGIWYGIKYLIFEDGKILNFLYELSTLSFWMEHLGAWYVAFLIPLYLLYPLYYDYTKNKCHKYYILMTILIISFMIYKLNLILYIHLSQILSGTVIFIIGDYVAQYIYKNTYNDTKLLLFSILFFIIKTITPLKNNFYICDLSTGFLGIAIVILGAKFFNICSLKRMHKILVFIGNYSLESYLYNIFLLQAVKYFKINNKINFFQNVLINEVIIYMGVMILGFLLSINTRKIIDFLTKRYR